jgi:hypothetical protein
MNKKKKPALGASASIKTKQFAGGKSKGFDVFNSTENTTKIQCHKCSPPLSKVQGEVRLCAECRAESAQTAQAFFDNFRRHRKTIKLDCYCYACDTPKSSAMMSRLIPICRKCAGELKAKGATAQSNFMSRATNNFLKGLKRAAAL